MKHLSLVTPLLAVTIFSGSVVAQDSPNSVIRGTKQFEKKVLISRLSSPWELTWGPDNMLWVTERTGKTVSRINPSTGERKAAITIDEISSPGGQDGLLGLALHPELLKGTGNDYVYISYSYIDKAKGPNPNVTDPANPYYYLYFKLVRLSYNAADQTLSSPMDLITGLPASNDHNGGRLKFGPDKKLYYTIGDHGHNQFGNACLLIESQRLPTKQEIQKKNYNAYVGKSLRINLDGSIPSDNPKLAGVVSHVYTYGHRNPQGLDIGPNGIIYSSEHGPKSDDEVNILTSGSNYGWPHVAGFKDNKAYVNALWAKSTQPPCSELKFNDLAIPPSVPQAPESAFKKPFVNPLATMFTVENDHNFADPRCKGVDFICWPTVGVSDVEYYESKGKGIPGWDKVLLVTTLKRGSLYVLPLSSDGKKAAGHFSRYFQSENRYRDTAVSPDGRTIYIATDPGGLTESGSGGTTAKMENPGAILVFTYQSEGGPGTTPPPSISKAEPQTKEPIVEAIVDGIQPQFTATQASNGKTAYTASCAVCHGSTMTNGAYGTPLAGEYFKSQWSQKSVRSFFEKTQTTMPPAHPGSLSTDTYEDIVAYILETNGFGAGNTPLKSGDAALNKMVLK